MFLTQEDLYSKIRQGDLKQIVGANDSVVDHAICTALGKVRSYLARYNTERIFNATGDQREGMLVAIAVDIAIYELVAIAQPNVDLTDRRERARAALDYLAQVRDQSLPTGWPLLPSEAAKTDEKPIISGGNRPRGNYM